MKITKVTPLFKSGDGIYESFVTNTFTLGVFVDLSKAFDTANHEILLKQLTYFGIKGIYISYLKNRKQFITYNKNQTTMLNILEPPILLSQKCYDII